MFYGAAQRRGKKKKRGPPGKVERLDLKAASLIPEASWPTLLDGISEGQSATAAGPPTRVPAALGHPFRTPQWRKLNHVSD